jgi:hypothetical protein
MTLYRVDMEDETGTPMCESCGGDALDSGVFGTRDEDDDLLDLVDGDGEPLCGECGEPIPERNRLGGGLCDGCWDEVTAAGDELVDLVDGPGEEDWTTGDYRTWREVGTCRTWTVTEGRDWRECWQQRCAAEGYWPQLWHVSDHGNAEPLAL